MEWVIYTLTNPRTGEVRYVGKTFESISSRLRRHISAALRAERRTHAQNMILSLLSMGLQPTIQAIESGSGPGWAEAERRWIAFYKSQGAKLANFTDGGEGAPGRGTPELRKEIARKAHDALSPEQRRLRAEKAMSGRTHQQRAACAVAMIEANARRTPEERSKVARKRESATTHEQRSAIAKARQAAKTPEERSATIKKSNQSRTPEQRRAVAIKANAQLTPEERSERTRKGLLSQTPEQRSARARHAYAVRYGLPE